LKKTNFYWTNTFVVKNKQIEITKLKRKTDLRDRKVKFTELTT